MTDTEGRTVQRVTRILARADLSGLSPAPPDEYAPEAEDLVRRARRGALTAEDIRQVWRHWFDDGLPGHPDTELRQLAARITVTVGLTPPLHRPQREGTTPR